MEYGVLFEKGCRDRNQDSLALHRMMTQRGEVVLAAVCDGLGGMDAGEIASGYVAERLSIWFYEDLPDLLEKRRSKKALENALLRVFYDVHERLVAYGEERKLRLGTTLSMLLIVDGRYYLFHIGDSAVYLLGRIGRKITKEHSISGNVLQKCIGIGAYKRPDQKRGRIRKKDVFLLATDGIWRALTEEEWGQILGKKKRLNGKKAEKILRDIAAKQNRLGKADNMSAIYLRVE